MNVCEEEEINGFRVGGVHVHSDSSTRGPAEDRQFQSNSSPTCLKCVCVCVCV